MDSNLLVETLGVPAAVSAGVLLLARWILPGEIAARWAAALGFAGGFFAGYALMPSWAELVPSRHWHWLPWLGAAAAVIGSIGRASGVWRLERWLLHLLAAIVAAWLLVPTWSSLNPPRSVYLPIVAGYLLLLSGLIEPLPQVIGAPRFSAFLFVAAAVTAVMAAYSVSETYGRVAAAAAGALAGITAVIWFFGSRSDIAGFAPAYAVVTGGSAFVAAIEPEPPLLALLALPAAPVGLWICRWGPLKRQTGAKLVALQMLAVGVPLAVAVVLVCNRLSSGTSADGF